MKISDKIRNSTTKRAHTWNERSIVGAKAVGQLALVNVAGGQCLLTELLLLLSRLLLVHGPTSQLVSLEGAKLELRVKVETRGTGLRPGLPVAAQVELATGVRVRVKTVRAGTRKGLLIVRICVVVFVPNCVRRWGVRTVRFRWLLRTVVAVATAAAWAASGPGSATSGLRRR